jgi:hypothetical protein
MLLSLIGGIMLRPIESRLAELTQLSRTALCDLWKEHFDTSPPPQLRRDLMIPILGSSHLQPRRRDIGLHASQEEFAARKVASSVAR